MNRITRRDDMVDNDRYVGTVEVVVPVDIFDDGDQLGIDWGAAYARSQGFLDHRAPRPEEAVDLVRGQERRGTWSPARGWLPPSSPAGG